MKIIYLFTTLIIIVSCTNKISSNNNKNIQLRKGDILIRQYCAACHKVDKDMIAPKLSGVKQKWIEAGELNYLYEYISNPDSLYNSGKSKLTIKIRNYAPISMPPFPQLTTSEIDSIFAFADNL